MKPEDAATIAAAQAAARERQPTTDELRAAHEQRAREHMADIERERSAALAEIVKNGRTR